ncbi:MAG: methyltransferase domain-containing protein [Kiritimatiellae bacterium]|nr:methyltransferase domain-containing protein [Kiritimatiellia bacterium]MDW8459229.1 small ribosomal subunit Rsm22 family protein [Verrucomicrobiota bacterium]
MTYPTELEAFWLREARTVWGARNESELIECARPYVQALSDRFTVDRGRAIELYADDPASRAAYGLFFFPQTFARTLKVLEECWRAPTGVHEVRILDLGAGTGAAGFAALSMLGGRRAILCAVDRSREALDALRRLAESARALWPAAEVQTVQRDLTEPPSAPDLFDLILCSFALNEIAEGCPSFDAAEWICSQMDRLKPEGLLVLIEPALRSCAERLERLRDRAAAEGWANIVGPCPHHGPCPMLAEGRFWCHEVRSWQPPRIAETINRLLYRDLPHLKFSFLAVRRSRGRGAISDAHRGRLVAPLTPQRGKFVTRVCCADGQLRELEILTRSLDAAGRATLRRMERGTRVAFVPDRVLGDGTLRASSLIALEPNGPTH